MHINREFFIYLIEHSDPDTIRQLDRTLCKCNYCWHWKYQMKEGKFRPLVNELDAELAQVHTTGQLYDFLKSKQDDI